ncbi:hypothetical protein [Corallococcus sp. CA054B]|uniref:hypothetical protein n=1 Tax=Corallococcus sp. CA054B TaxID=2316734 RepID=UPI0011C3CF51|nr:hypothetical protein [Corallococcus sp. CA054B]
MPTFGEKPRPRALLLGLTNEENQTAAKLLPTCRTINALEEVEQHEWDLLITRHEFFAKSHLFIISIGCTDLGYVQHPINETAAIHTGTFGVTTHSRSTEFIIPDHLPRELSLLIQRNLLPGLQSETQHKVIGTRLSFNGRPLKGVPLDELLFTPFISSTKNEALAGKFTRQGVEAEVWCLPPTKLDLSAWISVALKEWHKSNPRRFPTTPGWEHDEQWMNSQEKLLHEQIETISREREVALRNFATEEQILRTQLNEERQKADAGERRLLTAQDEELVAAVKDAFAEFGFDTQNMDEVFPSNDRREDLRISLPGTPKWIAICEVKGYFKGAKISDLLKISRFQKRFIMETGAPPNQSLYIVNHYLQDPPSTRGAPLSNNAEEIKAFAEDDGVVISTADIYQLLTEFRSNQITKEQIRSMIQQARGVFSLKSSINSL